MNIEEQIKEMKERWEEYFELHKHKEAITGSILIEWRDVYHFLDKELPNLLTQQRGDAVRELRQTMSKSWYEKSEDKNTGYWIAYIDELLSLQSLDKGDKGE